MFWFQDFFFETVITVNLTAMLVHTTMFIGVTNQLPQTAYIKMVDIWLIFNLMIPFILVVTHTYIDTLRTETNEDLEEDKKPLHVVGGDITPKSIAMAAKVCPTPVEDRNHADLVHRDEKLGFEARKKFYKSVRIKEKSSTKTKLKRVMLFTKLVNYLNLYYFS